MRKKYREEHGRFIDDHLSEITKNVLKTLEEQKETLKIEALTIIKNYITPAPPHYEAAAGAEKYIESGTIDLDMTVNELLSQELVQIDKGTPYATFITYGEDLENEYNICNRGAEITEEMIKEYIKNHLQCEITEQELDALSDAYLGRVDEENNGLSLELASARGLTHWLGIDLMTLAEVREK